MKNVALAECLTYGERLTTNQIVGVVDRIAKEKNMPALLVLRKDYAGLIQSSMEEYLISRFKEEQFHDGVLHYFFPQKQMLSHVNKFNILRSQRWLTAETLPYVLDWINKTQHDDVLVLSLKSLHYAPSASLANMLFAEVRKRHDLASFLEKYGLLGRDYGEKANIFLFGILKDHPTGLPFRVQHTPVDILLENMVIDALPIESKSALAGALKQKLKVCARMGFMQDAIKLFASLEEIHIQHPHVHIVESAGHIINSLSTLPPLVLDPQTISFVHFIQDNPSLHEHLLISPQVLKSVWSHTLPHHLNLFKQWYKAAKWEARSEFLKNLGNADIEILHSLGDESLQEDIMTNTTHNHPTVQVWRDARAIRRNLSSN